MGGVKNIKSDEFKREVLQSNKPALIDFWAEWCAPCKKMEPVIAQLNEQFGNYINFFKLNVDENAAVATEYSIRSIPTLFLFKNGEVVERVVGIVGKKELLKKLKKLL